MSQPFESFYCGKRVLVTGHTGFTGGWVVSWLKQLDAKVCGYGLPPISRPNFFDAALIDRGISSVFADIRDRETLANIFADFQPEIVFHAISSRNLEDPIETYEINVAGTLNLLEEARLTGSARSIIVLQESLQSNLRPVSEPECSWAASIQSETTTCAQAFAECFFRDSRTRLGILKLPALIGGGDWRESSLLGRLLHSVLAGEAIALSGSELHLCHALEAVHACLRCAAELFSHGHAAGIRGFHNSPPISDVALAKQFAALWGEACLPIEIRESERSHRPDISAQDPSGWSPVLSFEDAIAWTVEWYQAYFTDLSSAVGSTQGQIERYSKLRFGQPDVPTSTIG